MDTVEASGIPVAYRNAIKSTKRLVGIFELSADSDEASSFYIMERDLLCRLCSTFIDSKGIFTLDFIVSCDGPNE